MIMLVFRLPVMALMLTFDIPGGSCTEIGLSPDEPGLGVLSGCSVPGKLLTRVENATVIEIGENSGSTLLQ